MSSLTSWNMSIPEKGGGAGGGGLNTAESHLRGYVSCAIVDGVFWNFFGIFFIVVFFVFFCFFFFTNLTPEVKKIGFFVVVVVVVDFIKFSLFFSLSYYKMKRHGIRRSESICSWLW